MNIDQLYRQYKQSYKVCTDTRKISSNCIFFALKGPNFNGNSFAQAAIDQGALLAVIDEAKYQIKGSTMLVDDVLATLQQLATFHRETLKIPLIALTGSNGKTTTKELIQAVLCTKFNSVATQGNLNNHIGVPLTLLAMGPKTQMAVVEMGANHLKEIEALCAIAKPDFGYITNFGKAHLEGFGSEEGVVKGKSELYKFLDQNNKLVFVNANDQTQLKLTSHMKRFIFDGTASDVHIELVSTKPFIKVRVANTTIESNLIGLYNFSNIAAAVAIGRYFNIPPKDIKAGIENYVPKNNRSQILSKGSNKIILDAYNANPSSMEVALTHLSEIDQPNKMVILGDMFELGPSSQDEHQKLVNSLEAFKFKACYLIGEAFFNCKVNSNLIKRFKSFDDFKQDFDKLKIENSHILIKGSRGMALERVYDLL